METLKKTVFSAKEKEILEKFRHRIEKKFPGEILTVKVFGRRFR